MKRIITLALSFVLSFSLLACGKRGGDSESQPISSLKPQVWTAYGTEKIIADADYSQRTKKINLEINAFRNEYESAQIVITANGSVENYSITLNDLKSGENTLEKESFEVYNQKYVFVEQIKDNNVFTGAGYYPDALLPYETAVKYGENKIEGGRNQSIWITLKANKEQPSGNYTGKFNLDIDGEKYEIPVSVTVFDYTLSDEVHSKSSFLINAEELAVGELDSTNEMIEKYHDFLLDFRISPNHLAGNEYYAYLQGDNLEVFLDNAVKASKDPRCSNYNVPYIDSSASVVVDGQTSSIQTVDFAVFRNTLIEMAKRSVQEKVNLFKKAQTYIVFLDEYDYNNRIVEANYNFEKIDELCKEVAQELSTTLSCDDENFKAELIKDVARMRHKCVGALNENMTSKATMVATIDKYHTSAIRQEYIDWATNCYGEDYELWTYTAMDPDPPYPTYHIEDALISSRLLGWMMYNYDIIGNLYWNTTLYTYSDGYTTNGQIQDYYNTALRFWRANGDGYLMYPGRPYGIYGPVASNRLHSIRDANEDYDLLYALENAYKQRGVSGDDFNSILKYLTKDLYNGTQCNSSFEINELLQKARRTLAQLLTLAQNGVVVERASLSTVTEESGEKYDLVKFDVSANVQTEIKADGKTLSGEQRGDVVVYKVEVPLDDVTNLLDMTAKISEKEYALSLDLGAGGKVKTETKNFIEFIDEISTNNGASKEQSSVNGENAVKLSSPSNSFRADVNLGDFTIDGGVKTVTIRIYADREGSTVNLLYRGVSGSGLIPILENYQLKQGVNEFTFDTSAFNCDKDGRVQTIRTAFTLGDTDTQIYLLDIVTEVKL